MIQLDNDFANTEAKQAGQYEPPPAGGYILKVLTSVEKISNSGNPMVSMELDIEEGEFKNAFEKYPAKFMQNCTGKSTPYFKGMLLSFKVSNPHGSMAAIIQNNQFNPGPLVGMLIGGNIREEEFYNQSGELKTTMGIQNLCDTEFVRQGHVKPLGIKKAVKPVGSIGQPIQGNNPPPHTEEFPLPF